MKTSVSFILLVLGCPLGGSMVQGHIEIRGRNM